MSGVFLSFLLSNCSRYLFLRRELPVLVFCVNALAPGYILTDINRDQLGGETGDLLKKKIPLKRFATVEELDTIISMLLNTSNTYMTGAVVAVDGGLSTGL